MSVPNHGKHTRQGEVIITQSQRISRVFLNCDAGRFQPAKIKADRPVRIDALQLLTLRDRVFGALQLERRSALCA